MVFPFLKNSYLPIFSTLVKQSSIFIQVTKSSPGTHNLAKYNKVARSIHLLVTTLKVIKFTPAAVLYYTVVSQKVLMYNFLFVLFPAQLTAHSNTNLLTTAQPNREASSTFYQQKQNTLLSKKQQDASHTAHQPTPRTLLECQLSSPENKFMQAVYFDLSPIRSQ